MKWVTATDRFLAKVKKQAGQGCWVWIGSLNEKGYGHYWDRKRVHLAHKWYYEKVKGKVPDGYVLDHLCRNHPCVRPDHLEPVTVKENTLRGESEVAKNAQKTHCKWGHPLEGDNLYVPPGRAERYCRTCLRRNTQTYHERHKEKSTERGRKFRERNPSYFKNYYLNNKHKVG